MTMVSNMAAETATTTASLPTASLLPARRRWAAYCFLVITIIVTCLLNSLTLAPYAEYTKITEFNNDPASKTTTRTNANMTTTKDDLPYLSKSTEANAITVAADDMKAPSKNSTTDAAKAPNGVKTLNGDKEKVEEVDELKGIAKKAGEFHLADSARGEGNSNTPTLTNQSSPDQQLFLEYAVHDGWSNIEQLQNWIIQRLAWNQTIPSSLGVFVATDSSETQKESFAAQLSAALGDLQSKYNFVNQIHYSSSFQEYSKALKQSLVYPDIFLDQQIAACAPIVFTSSKDSTFSMIIGWLRQNCDFSSVQ
jgi:hypothetical protein